MEKRSALAVYNEIYQEQTDLYRAAARQCGLPDCAFWVLYTLRDAPHPLTQSDICAAVCQPKQTVHSSLKKLESAGYLRFTEGRDRRSKYLALTSLGETLASATVDRVIAAETEAMGTLTEPERTQFLALSRRYNAALRQYLPHAGEQSKE